MNGSSLKWFSWRYGQIGAEFERIIAFEARAFKPTKLWDSMPPWIMSKLQYFNVPAAAEAGAKLNPWRILEGIATERDYVVVKLDIDHAATELALVHQLLDDRKGVCRHLRSGGTQAGRRSAPARAQGAQGRGFRAAGWLRGSAARQPEPEC